MLLYPLPIRVSCRCKSCVTHALINVTSHRNFSTALPHVQHSGSPPTRTFSQGEILLVPNEVSQNYPPLPFFAFNPARGLGLVLRVLQHCPSWDPTNQTYTGTWLGITRTGRLAVLTNFRESSSAAAIGEKSRGAMVTSFLTSSFHHPNTPETADIPSEPSTREWLHNLLSNGELTGVGGFSLLCGILRPKKRGSQDSVLEELAVISNRTAAGEGGMEAGAHWIAGTKGETHGLSNSLFDRPWPKVKLGQHLLCRAVEKAIKEDISEDVLVERLLGILSHDTLPVLDRLSSYEAQLEALRHSVFIPAFNASVETLSEESGEALALPQNALPERETPSRPKDGDRRESAYANGESNGDISGVLPTQAQWWRDRKYGTQKQTVVLVDNNGRVKYVERTLWDECARPVKGGERYVVEEWAIEGWEE